MSQRAKLTLFYMTSQLKFVNLTLRQYVPTLCGASKRALANQICCTHNMCIITQNDRKCQNASKSLLRNGTESNHTSSYILLDHSNAFGLSGGNFLSRTSLPEPILSGEGGDEFSTISPFGGPLHFDWTKLAHAQLGYGAYKI